MATNLDQRSSGFSVTPIGKEFAAIVRGIDLCAGVGGEVVEKIEQALADHGVLVFRNQPIDDDQQQAFIQQFGPPVVMMAEELKGGAKSHPHFFDVTTVDEEGRPLPPESARGMYLLANKLWHTDGSQAQPPVRLSALSARTLPSAPPPTEYADMRAAYEGLPKEKQREIEGLMVQHDITYSRSKIGMKASDFSEKTLKSRPPVVHPLVRTNPRTGRKSLYLASHASKIIDWDLEKGRDLLDELTEFATQPQFVYSHQWQKHDLVMWDDSWTMHRATEYNNPEPRVMRWCGVRELEAV